MLGFVGTTRVKGAGMVVSDWVRYDFSHPTFVEFFAAFHLTTLPQDQLLALIAIYGESYKFDMLWLFFFGLTGNVFPRDISTVLKPFSLRYRSHHSISGNFITCSESVNSNLFMFIQEIGLKGGAYRELLQSVELVGMVNSSLCVRYLMHKEGSSHCPIDFLVNKWNLLIYLEFSNFTVTIEDVDHSLNEESFQNLIKCINLKFIDGKVCAMFTFVTSLSKYSIWHPYNIQLLNQLVLALPNLQVLDLDIVSLPCNNNIVLPKLQLPSGSHLEHINVSVNPSVLDKVLKEVLTSITIHALTIKCHYSSFSDESCTDLIYSQLSLSSLLMKPSALQSFTLLGLCPTNLSMATGLTELRHLELHSRGLIDVDSITACLSRNQHLLKLVMSSSKYLDEDADKQRIFENLPHSLKEMHLTDQLTNKGIVTQSEALKNLHSLSSLSLNANHLTIDGVSILSEALKTLDSLLSLSLWGNRISDDGVELLADALKSHKKLHFLDLTGNTICKNENGIAALAQLRTLSSLTLLNTWITRKGVQALVDVFKNSTNFSKLELSVDNGGDLEPLAEFKNLNHLIVYLNYSPLMPSHFEVFRHLTELRTLEIVSRIEDLSAQNNNHKLMKVVKQLVHMTQVAESIHISLSGTIFLTSP